MTQNFLFMFEFVVENIWVSKPNKCAPDEYPECCEVSFRNNVFASICDLEFNNSIDPCKPKCGKSCLFSLESPITDGDKLQIHIYKKKTGLCKFLIGCTDLPIKNVFDKAIENFNIENPGWQSTITRHLKALPKPKVQTNADIVDNNCDTSEEDRREQLCPASELTKQLLPIFNLKGCQTGNVILLIRLVAIGPTIVSTFPFSRMCNVGCENKCLCCNSKANGSNKEANGNSACNPNFECTEQHKSSNGCMALRDPCHKGVKKVVGQRHFAFNSGKGCPYDVIEDHCARAAKCKEQKQKRNCSPSEHSSSYSCEDCMEECEAVKEARDPFECDPCSADTCDDCVQDPYSPCGQCIQPCFQTPRRPDPGPEAYDEFEACLNGSGLVIRVLKDTHQVENIFDGTEELNDNVSECNKQNGKENIHKSNGSSSNMLKRSNFVRNHIKRRTGGHIINHSNLPKIRANIKYSGNGDCYTEKYDVPYSKIKTHCDSQSNKIDNYRTYRARTIDVNENGDTILQPKHRKDEKNCCVQVDREEIKKIMKGLDVDTRKKGIEVCYKTCEETDSDIFLVKLGSKHKSEHKKNNIEIELKTPKVPVAIATQHVTTETQITETELDAALANICNGKKGGKGKKKKQK